MADENDWKPGDHEAVILRKILQRLGTGIMIDGSTGGGGVVMVDGTVTVQSSSGALTDGSDTITTGGVSQQIFAAKTGRKYFFFENVSSGDLWINFGGAATVAQPSIKVVANGSFVMECMFISDQAIHVIGATTGQEFSAKEA